MTETFICKFCHKQKPKNIRLKGTQGYYKDIMCQRARKNEWQKKKMVQDPHYHPQQYECLDHWRKMRPLDQYHRRLRQQHPSYVQKNRKQQILRHRKRTALLSLFSIVKMDASTPVRSNAYVMGPSRINASEKVVNVGALFDQLAVLPNNTPSLKHSLTFSTYL